MAAAAPAPHGKQQHQELAGATDPAATVLELLLQHAPPDQGWVCALLRSSKAVAAAATERLAGTLCMTARPRSLAAAEALAGWVRRHGPLLRELDFTPLLDTRDAHAAAAGGGAGSPDGTVYGAGLLLADALQAAAAGGGMKLAAFTCRRADAANMPLLAALPDGGSLTRLALGVGPAGDPDAPEPEQRRQPWGDAWDREMAALDALRAGLARLPSLRDLELHSHIEFDPNVVHLATALTPLTALTALAFTGVCYLGEQDGIHPETLPALPASLRRLTAPLYCGGCLDLGRLTALAHLELTGAGMLDSYAVLPPSLESVRCGILTGVGALRHLPKLRVIVKNEEYAGPLTASQLVEITALGVTTGLVALACSPDQGADDGGMAAALAPLARALRSLRLKASKRPPLPVFGPGVVAAVAAAVPRLRRLVLDVHLDAAALAALPGAVACLDQLRELKLAVFTREQLAQDPDVVGACIAGVLGLAQLRALGLVQLPLGEAGLVAELAAGTQLSSLQLCACGVGSAQLQLPALAAALASLRRLRELTLFNNPDVSSEQQVRAAFGRASLKLTVLPVCHQQQQQQHAACH